MTVVGTGNAIAIDSGRDASAVVTVNNVDAIGAVAVDADTGYAGTGDAGAVRSDAFISVAVCSVAVVAMTDCGG